MKKRLLGLFAVTSMMLMSLSASAAMVIWEPTDVVDPINSSVITFGFGTGITDVAIYDDSDTALTTTLLQFDAGFAEVLFTQDGIDWVITSSQDTLVNPPAVLTDSNNFIVAVSDDDGTSWTANLTYVQDAVSTDLYHLTYTDITVGNNLVTLTDVQPVPIPAALWLFGSALLGLVGVSRRKSSDSDNIT